MKVLLLLTFLSVSLAAKYLTSDDLTKLFTRAGKNELSESDWSALEDLTEILYLPQDTFVNDEKRLAARSSLLCLVCRTVFTALTDVVNGGASDEDIVDAITLICNRLSLTGPKVCHGAVLLNVPILTYIIRHSPEAEPRTFCGLVFQSRFKSDSCVSSDKRFNWEVELPPVGGQPRITYQNSDEPFNVAIITDVHIDPLYEPFGVADCSDPICCRKGQEQRVSKYTYNPVTDEHIVLNSVVQINGEPTIDIDAGKTLRNKRTATRKRQKIYSQPAGYWGDYRSCDSPLWAFDDVIDRIHSAHEKIDAIYYMGDTIDHHMWETTYEMIDNVNRYVVQKIRNTFGDNVPVIATIGNHESQPTNQFAPESIKEEKLNTTWLYEGLAKKWGPYLTEEAKNTLRRRGDFSMVLRPGLRVISLNTNIAYKYNWWLAFDPLDAKSHLDWLVSELYKAELAGEKVHIVTHIPAGVHDLVYTWTREYNRIINRFHKTIVAEFNGHTHSDEFKVFYSSDDKNVPIAVSWGGGGTTAYSDNNVNYKIAVFDPVTYMPVSINNYIYNLTEANLTPNKRPHWFQLYDIKNTYELKDLTPNSVNELVYSMATNKKYLLEIYSAFYSRLSDAQWQYCDDYCKLDDLCKTVVTVLYDREKCNELSILYFSKK